MREAVCQQQRSDTRVVNHGTMPPSRTESPLRHYDVLCHNDVGGITPITSLTSPGDDCFDVTVTSYDTLGKLLHGLH